MENNDSPKTFNNSEDTEETIEEEKKTPSKNKKRKKLNLTKKNKKHSKYLVKKNKNIIKVYENKSYSENFFYNNKSHYYKYVGKTLFLFMDKYDNPLLIIGPHWPLFACFFGTINILYFIITIKLWHKFGFKSKLINQISYWLYTLSYSYTSLINPGYPKNNHERKTGYPRDEFYFCSVCKFYVKISTDASHCDECGICIEGMDHHCPWTSHCVGKNNTITFYIFVLSTLFSICYLPLAFCHFLK